VRRQIVTSDSAGRLTLPISNLERDLALSIAPEGDLPPSRHFAPLLDAR
jgi:hypothetical protein